MTDPNAPDAMPLAEAIRVLARMRDYQQNYDHESRSAPDVAIRHLRAEVKAGDGAKFCGAKKP